MKVVIATTEKETKDAFSVRNKVFVEEQNVPIEIEIDEHDTTATHFVLYDEGKPVGAGRFRVVESFGKIERVCVLKGYRNRGAGKQIMKKMIDYARETGLPKVKLNAQTHALSFYEKLGFYVVSDEFMDAGIPHKTMELKL